MRKISTSVLRRQRRQEAVSSRNRQARSELRTALASVLACRTRIEAEPIYRRTVALIDRLAGKRVLHHSTAARRKSRISRHLNTLP